MANDTETLNPETFMDAIDAEEVKTTALAIAPKALQAPQPSDKPSYASGFEGVASEPFRDAVRAVLLAPVDPKDVLIRPDGIVYLPAVWYRMKLTAAFGPGGWATVPRSEAKLMGDIVVYHGALFALGRFVSEAWGECGYRASNKTMSYADALEGARSALLPRVCKDLGVASELWDKEWVANWQSQNAHQEDAGAKGKIWVKNGAPKEPAKDPIPQPPSAERPRAAATDLPPLSTDDFLAKAAAALDWVGDDAFRSALDLFKVKNPGDLVEDKYRQTFIAYLRKLPRKVK